MYWLKALLVFIFLTVTLIYLTKFSTNVTFPEATAEEAQKQLMDDINSIDFKETPDNTEPTTGGEITIGMHGTHTLNPILNTVSDMEEILLLMFEPLFKLDSKQKPQPNLVERFEYLTDGKSINLRLNRNITWHDGTPFTASDVIFTIKAIRAAGEDTVYKHCVKDIQGYSYVDESTVKITFNKDIALAEYALQFPVLPEHIYKNNMEPETPIGSGSYKFVDYTYKTKLTMEAVSNSNKQPYIQKITALMIPDNAESNMYLYEEGIIDITSTDNTEWLQYTVRKASNAKEYIGNSYEFLGFNFLNEILAQRYVREAITHLISKDEIVSEIYNGHAVAATSIVNPESWLYNSDVKDYEYGKHHAQLLLIEWNYSDESGRLELMDKEMSFRLLVNSENNKRLKMAEYISKQLNDFGIEIILEVLPYNEYMQRLIDKDFDLVMGSWQFSTMPDYSLAFRTSEIEEGANFFSYSNMLFDQTMDTSFILHGDNNLRKSISYLQKYIAEELLCVGLVYRKSVVLSDQKIFGEISPTVNNIFDNIWNWHIYDR